MKQSKNKQQPKQKTVVKSNQIEDIFKKAKKEKRIAKAVQKKSGDKQKKIEEKKLKQQWKEQTINRKKQVEQTHLRVDAGLKIYSEDQLKIEKGGNTRQCPFDCNCCF